MQPTLQLEHKAKVVSFHSVLLVTNFIHVNLKNSVNNNNNALYLYN